MSVNMNMETSYSILNHSTANLSLDGIGDSAQVNMCAVSNLGVTISNPIAAAIPRPQPPHTVTTRSSILPTAQKSYAPRFLQNPSFYTIT